MTIAHRYDFDNLSFGDKLELFASSPLVRQLAEQLPIQGNKTKPALSTTVGTLVVGVASILAGSDHRADAELAYQWPILRPALVAAGLRVPEEPITTQHFRDYRQRFVTEACLAQLHVAFKDQAVQLARLLGLLVDHGEPWLAPSMSQLVYGDGAWFAPASEVGRLKRRRKGKKKRKLAPHPSRSKCGQPRLVDYDTHGKTYGYNHVTLYVRGEASRLRVALSLVAVGPNGAELDGMELELQRLVEVVGTGFRAFVYDGAARGVHHRAARRLGILSVNLPHGMDSRDDWSKGLNKVVGKKAHIVTVQLPAGCVHHVNIAYGCFYQLERDAFGRWVRCRVLEHVEARPIVTGDAYRWELDVAIPCDHGVVHTWTIDPNGELPSNRRVTVKLAEQLRIVTPNGERFAGLYGVRNNAEADNRLIRTDLGMGRRARSYARKDHEFDRLLVSLLKNALVLAEHGPAPFKMQRRRSLVQDRLSTVHV